MFPLSRAPNLEEEMVSLSAWGFAFIDLVVCQPPLPPPLSSGFTDLTGVCSDLSGGSRCACHLGSPRSYLGMADCTKQNGVRLTHRCEQSVQLSTNPAAIKSEKLPQMR